MPILGDEKRPVVKRHNAMCRQRRPGAHIGQNRLTAGAHRLRWAPTHGLPVHSHQRASSLPGMNSVRRPSLSELTPKPSRYDPQRTRRPFSACALCGLLVITRADRTPIPPSTAAPIAKVIYTEPFLAPRVSSGPHPLSKGASNNCSAAAHFSIDHLLHDGPDNQPGLRLAFSQA